MSWYCQLLKYFKTKWKDFVLITLLASWVLPPKSLETSECVPVKLKDQIYSLCRWMNSHTPRHSYIYFMYLNMKYTFYRCFTRLLSVHRSPKTYVPKGHLQQALPSGWGGHLMRRPAARGKGPSTGPIPTCPALACVLELPQRKAAHKSCCTSYRKQN